MNLMIIIINFKFLNNIIFKKINVFIKYNLDCQSLYLFFKIFKSFKNLFEKFIGSEILLEKNSLEIGIDLGNENNFNLDSLIVSFASPSQEQDKIELENGENGYDSEDEKVYEKEENNIPNKSIDKDKKKDTDNNTQLEENNTRENNNTVTESPPFGLGGVVDEDISKNNSVDIEEGFVGKLRRNFGFDNLPSLSLSIWNKNSNKNSSSSSSSNNESSISDSNANANSSSSSSSNNNENSISSSTNTNNHSKGLFYIDEDSDSDFGDFDDE